MSVAVIIVNWSSGQLLKGNLTGFKYIIIAQKNIVVDNASIDDSVNVALSLPGDKLCQCRSNVGFTEGNEIAFAHYSDGYAVLLNHNAFLNKLTEEFVQRDCCVVRGNYIWLAIIDIGAF